MPEPESMYPETTALKSLRSPGSGDLEQISIGPTYSGSGLISRLAHLDRFAFVAATTVIRSG
jgi:hypothetical protein